MSYCSTTIRTTALALTTITGLLPTVVSAGLLDGVTEARVSGEQYLDVSLVPMYQHALREDAGSGNYTFDVIGKFTIVDRPAGSAVGNTDVVLWVNSSDTLGGLDSTSELARKAGLAWEANDIGADSSNTSYLVLAVDQWFMEDRLSVGVGKYFPGQAMLASPYLADNSNTFTSKLISGNPVVSWWEAIGIGTLVGYWGDEWFIQGGLVDAKAGPDDLDFSSFADAEYAYMLEASYSLPRNTGVSTVGAVLYYVDERNDLDSEYGLVAQFTHEFGLHEAYATFARYSYRQNGEGLTNTTQGNAPDLKQGLFVGGAWNQPFGRNDQQIGLALMHGTVSDFKAEQGFNNQYGVEAYWSYQPLPWMKLIPNLQFLRNKDEQLEGVVGIRLNVGFTRHWEESSLLPL